MFRAQQNVFDDVVAKATDENLTSENWEFILDVCDKVNSSESGAKDAVSAMIKRLAHRNANVQLYTLELANALSQNCGIKMHRELSSKSFTDALLRLAGDRTTHQQVKSKILERIEEWTKMFSKNPELGIMEQAYGKLKTQNPNLQPPQAPVKRQITDYDRQKEEEELQMALKLSIQDNKGKTTAPAQKASELSAQAGPSSSPAPVPSGPVPSGTSAATVSRVRALFDFIPNEPSELQFRKGDVIAVIESVYKDWWKGSLRGQTGIFPLNYVEKLQDPTPDELAREAEMEAEVFGQIKTVEKLLALLSTNTGDLSIRENEEITELYHSTVAIRPKLIELIGKYTQKKDDLQQLNEKFIKARRDYESLLETSMSQPAVPYGRPGQAYPGYGQHPPPGGYPPQRYYATEGQPPSTGPPHYPAGAQPPAAPGQFQPPYPVASPPPQSHTPLATHPTQQGGPPPQDAAGGQYAAYPPAGGPQRRQSHHSGYGGPQEMGAPVSPIESRTQPQYPPSAPNPGVQQIQQQDHTGGDQHYSPSVYSHNDSAHDLHQQHPQAYPPQQGHGGYPPQPQQGPPPQPSFAPPAPPNDMQQYPGQAPPNQYQAYQPATTPQPQQAYVGGGGGNPGSYYR